MSRICKKKPSVCMDEPLAHGEVWQKITLLRHILSSCYGPFGRLKQIHNNVGGSVLTTSTSAVLLKAITFSEPLVKLMAAAIVNHTTRFSDCGLFAGIFAIALIENVKRLDLAPDIGSQIYKYLLQECNRYLNTDGCGCKVKVDFNNIQSLMGLAHSVITSKQACMLSPYEAEHITSLTVQAFLQSVPCVSSCRTCFGRTVTMLLEGQPVTNSAVFSGLLVDMPELNSTDLKKLGPAPYKIVLFSASLSGDLSEMGEVALEIQTGVNPEEALLDQLLKLGKQVVKDGVSLFACQKVIHPVLQQYLKEHGLVTIERLGVSLMEPIAQITGALIVASPYSPVTYQVYGEVGGLRLHRHGSKELLQLLPLKEPTVSTMVLCHRNETMLAELKVTCQRAEHVLRFTLKEPYALFGGGCTETLLSAYIRDMSESKATEAAQALNCSPPEFCLGTEAFCCSLRSVALSLGHDSYQSLMDLTHAHCWLTEWDFDSESSTLHSCSCGLVKNRPGLEKTSLNTGYHSFLPEATDKSHHQPNLLDSFSAKLNALNMAVEIANFVLDVKYIIKDVN